MQPNGDRPVILSFRIEHLLGWGVTFVLCIMPAFLWLQVHPLSAIQGFPAIMLALGRVTGLIGMVMFALNLVYATRWRFLEFWFGGLNRVYIAHHMLGGLSLIMLTFHPLFLALRYVTTSIMEAALLLLPNGLLPVSALLDRGAELHAVVLQQWAIFFGIISFWGMVALLLVTFFIRIPYRIWLFTHKFLGVAFFLGGLHVLFIASDTSKYSAIKYYILGMTAIGLIAYAYKTLFGGRVIRKYRYRVTDVRLAGGNVTQVAMEPLAKSMPYKSGQFVFVRFLDAKQDGLSREWHPFSIASDPGSPELRLSMKGLGDFTNNLPSLHFGASAEVEGAYGRFNYEEGNSKQQVWIGAGIGIAPFVSMVRTLKDQNDPYQIDLYYIVRNRKEIIDWQILYDTAVATGRLRIIPYITSEQNGRLTADFLESVSGDLTHKNVFICGPPEMMSSLRRQLRAKAVPGTSIYTEEFGMT